MSTIAKEIRTAVKRLIDAEVADSLKENVRSHFPSSVTRPAEEPGQSQGDDHARLLTHQTYKFKSVASFEAADDSAQRALSSAFHPLTSPIPNHLACVH